MDFSRLRQGEIVAGIAGIALIVTMFLPWYAISTGAVEPAPIPELPGIDQGSIPEVDDDANAWDALNDIDGFLIALAGLAGIALAGLAAAGRQVNLGGLPRGGVTASLGALAALLIVWRLLAQPEPGADFEFGIFLGLAAAIGVAVGATLALREGGFEPLPRLSGGARRSSGSRRSTARRSAASRSSSSRSSGSRSGGGSRSGTKRSSGSRSRSSGRKK